MTFDCDFIVVGAGSAGAVIASRLSEDPSCRVVLVEAGGPPPEHEQMPLAAAALQLDPETDWMYRGDPGRGGRGMNNHRVNVPRGKMLGGSSGINYMAYVRGHPGDFDRWETLGAEGWGYANVLPYFKKSERLNPSNEVHLDRDAHGMDGPLGVSVRSPVLPASRQFVAAAKALGIPEGDYNGSDRLNPDGVVSLFQTTTEHGRRSSTYHAFLEGEPEQRPNLTVITRAQVTRVLLEDDENPMRASGVEYLTPDGNRHRLFASREVILSAGAIGSPHLLMLSGIGPRRELELAEIECVVDLPDVGKHLKDHLVLAMLFDSPNAGTPMAEIAGAFAPEALNEWQQTGVGYASSSLYDAALWCSSGLGDEHSHDIQVGFVPVGYDENFFGRLCNFDLTAQFGDFTAALDPQQPRILFAVNPVLQRSEGEVVIRSNDPFEHPEIRLNYFAESHDLAQMVAAMRLVFDLAEHWPGATAGTWWAPPELARKHGYRPGEVPSDAFLESVALHFSNTIYHQCCTCRIGDVVDPALHVKGVAGLRVADASVMPDIISANTNAACIMIGERAAEMIAVEHRVRLATFVGPDTAASRTTEDVAFKYPTKHAGAN